MATPKTPFGLTPAAFNALIMASSGAGIDLSKRHNFGISQSIGTAKASAGSHARDGYVTVDGKRVPYCAAIDLSVKWLTLAEIKSWLEHLAWWGFAAWYRPWYTNGKPNFHIHAIYVGVPMKGFLQGQVKDFLDDRTGLVGHAKEKFYTAGPEQDKYIKALFDWANHNGPKPPVPPKAPKAPTATTPQESYENLWKVYLSGRFIFNAPNIDGETWMPVREWYEVALGLKDKPAKDLPGTDEDEPGVEAVRWHPETGSIYIQGRPLVAEIRLLNLSGEREGYARTRDLVKFSGLQVASDAKTRTVKITKTGGGSKA